MRMRRSRVRRSDAPISGPDSRRAGVHGLVPVLRWVFRARTRRIAGRPSRVKTTDESETTDALGALAEAFLDECRRGGRPDVEEYARRHPELAERIRALFPTLAALEKAGAITAGG